LTELYDPRAFFAHAALLRQGFPHCAKFLTAASRRSLDRVPVPVWRNFHEEVTFNSTSRSRWNHIRY